MINKKDKSMKRKRKLKKTIGLIVLNIVFICICLVALFPIFYALYLSLSKNSGALSGSLRIIPKDITLDNYRAIIQDNPFLTWLKNSIILSIGTMVIAMGVSVFAAYAFSRYHFRGKKSVLKLLLLLNAFPQILSMFAIFRLFKQMDLLDSKMGLIFIYAGSMCIFSIWNLKGYFDTIPIEIEAASKIDGANDVQLISKIIFPLALPSMIVTAVMVVIFVWNEYI